MGRQKPHACPNCGHKLRPLPRFFNRLSKKELRNLLEHACATATRAAAMTRTLQAKVALDEALIKEIKAETADERVERLTAAAGELQDEVLTLKQALQQQRYYGGSHERELPEPGPVRP